MSKKLKLYAVAAGTALLTLQAQASLLPATFNDDITAVKGDMTTMIGGLVLLLLAVVGWRYFKQVR